MAKVVPAPTVTLTLADYESLKSRADGHVAKAELTAWAEANEFMVFAVQVVELLRKSATKAFSIHTDDVEKAVELIDQWDRRRERLTEDAK